MKGNGAITQLVCNVLLLWRNHERTAYQRIEESGHLDLLKPEQQKILNEQSD